MVLLLEISPSNPTNYPNNTDFENFENNRFVKCQMCRYLFGLSHFPFLTAKLQKHLNQYNAIDPEFVKKVLQLLHVNDLISCADTLVVAKIPFEITKS